MCPLNIFSIVVRVLFIWSPSITWRYWCCWFLYLTYSHIRVEENLLDREYVYIQTWIIFDSCFCPFTSYVNIVIFQDSSLPPIWLFRINGSKYFDNIWIGRNWKTHFYICLDGIIQESCSKLQMRIKNVVWWRCCDKEERRMMFYMYVFVIVQIILMRYGKWDWKTFNKAQKSR